MYWEHKIPGVNFKKNWRPSSLSEDTFGHGPAHPVIPALESWADAVEVAPPNGESSSVTSVVNLWLLLG